MVQMRVQMKMRMQMQMQMHNPRANGAANANANGTANANTVGWVRLVCLGRTTTTTHLTRHVLPTSELLFFPGQQLHLHVKKERRVPTAKSNEDAVGQLLEVLQSAKVVPLVVVCKWAPELEGQEATLCLGQHGALYRNIVSLK